METVMEKIFKQLVTFRVLAALSACIFVVTVSAQDAQVSQPEIQIDPDYFPKPEETPPGNPFRDGQLGTWRVKRTYALQVDRMQTRVNTTDNVNLRTDGVYTVFYPFWNLPDGSSNTFWRIDNDEQWTFIQQINHYNPFGGFILENINPLGIYSASLYGFNNTLPTGVATNARFREIGVDGFEDYMYGRCSNRHFSFSNTTGIESKVTDRASHTGRYSLKVAPKETLDMLMYFAPCEPDPVPVVIR